MAAQIKSISAVGGVHTLVFYDLLINTNLFCQSRGGHFSLNSLSDYTKRSTLIDWLWTWVASGARQCVCDLAINLNL
jgi:hypothetical protein